MNTDLKPGALDLENPRSVKLWKTMLERSFMKFSRYFFKQRLGYKMIVNAHHEVIVKTLVKVFTGEITRLIINIPPGYTKTELAVISFVAWTKARNPKSRFIHVTYSDSLAMENSTSTRDIIESEEYQKMWGIKLRNDSKSKSTWKSQFGGGMQARAAGGAITGFRAGQPDDMFSGAFIVDDPLKPDDAFSEPAIKRINGRFNGVFRSRLMQERKTPMIVIMQRISQNDPCGFLLKGGTGERWHHLCLPVRIDNSKPYPKEYTHGIPIEHGLPDGPLWEFKHTDKELTELERADPYVFAAQYMQAPVALGGGIFKAEWWQYYTLESINPEFRIIVADTAQKTSERNDYSVFQCWGYLKGDIYLLDQIRGRWEAPELLLKARQFWNKHYGTGAARTVGNLRYMAIEDKSSGTGLIQTLSKGNGTEVKIPIKAVQRSKDKLTRAMDTVPHIASGRVYIPSDASFTLDLQAEFAQFSADDTHDFDDQVDTTMDACELLLGPKKKTGGGW